MSGSQSTHSSPYSRRGVALQHLPGTFLGQAAVLQRVQHRFLECTEGARHDTFSDTCQQPQHVAAVVDV